jgi:hypothetical protein
MSSLPFGDFAKPNAAFLTTYKLAHQMTGNA